MSFSAVSQKSHSNNSGEVGRGVNLRQINASKSVYKFISRSEGEEEAANVCGASCVPGTQPDPRPRNFIDTAQPLPGEAPEHRQLRGRGLRPSQRAGELGPTPTCTTRSCTVFFFSGKQWWEGRENSSQF